jgi:hypothetical protein
LTEILTESFCERCGTRYTFESAAPRRSRIGKVRTLGKGMKNFVLSDDSSFSEAMAEARSEQELAAVAHQLDAFHQTFNFCLTCRQYTCGECWNEADGRCLTCAPIPGMEEPSLAAEAVAQTAALVPEPEAAAANSDDAAWPDADLSSGRLSRALGLDEAEAEATLEAGDDSFVDHPGIAAAGVVAAAGEPAASVEPAPAPAPAPVAGLEPGQSLEDAVAAYEASLDADAAEGVAAVVEPAPVPEPEPLVAAAAIAAAPDEIDDEHDPLRAAMAAAALVSAVDGEDRDQEPATRPAPEAEAAAPEPEFVVAELEPEPVPLAAELEPEPEPVAAEPQPEPEPEPMAAEPEPEPVAAESARIDVIPQPVWPQPAPSPEVPAAPAPTPEQPAPPANPWLTVAPEEGDSPQWPAAPAWSSSPSSRELPGTLAGRPLLPLDDASGVWAASALEVLTGAPQAPVQQAAAAPAPAAQPCVSCGLSLSANARFCRRCGTRQG